MNFDINATFIYESLTFVVLILMLRHLFKIVQQDLISRNEYINEKLVIQRSAKQKLQDTIAKTKQEYQKQREIELDFEISLKKRQDKAEIALQRKLDIMRNANFKKHEAEVRNNNLSKKQQITELILQYAVEIKELDSIDLSDTASLIKLKHKLQDEITEKL